MNELNKSFEIGGKKEVKLGNDDFYLYKDISRCDVEELKAALRHFKAKDNSEGISRLEGELLNRKEINIREDFALPHESIQGPRKRDDKNFGLN